MPTDGPSYAITMLTPPVFERYYAATHHPNGNDMIITLPYSFWEPPVLKSARAKGSR